MVWALLAGIIALLAAFVVGVVTLHRKARAVAAERYDPEADRVLLNGERIRVGRRDPDDFGFGDWAG